MVRVVIIFDRTIVLNKIRSIQLLLKNLVDNSMKKLSLIKLGLIWLFMNNYILYRVLLRAPIALNLHKSFEPFRLIKLYIFYIILNIILIIIFDS